MVRMSHLLQMRGLKPDMAFPVATYTTSHLLQMRGLKHQAQRSFRSNQRSHLLQMRGLKLYPYYLWLHYIVASFTDAWIETFDYTTKIRLFYLSHLLQMRGLKLYEKLKKAGVLPVASFTDAWIETFVILLLDCK